VFSKIGALKERFHNGQIWPLILKTLRKEMNYIPRVTPVRGEGPHVSVLSNMH
jgi:hypothetical protein